MISTQLATILLSGLSNVYNLELITYLNDLIVIRVVQNYINYILFMLYLV